MSGVFARWISRLAMTAALIAGAAGAASATTISANSEYNLEGQFGLYFIGLNGAPSYRFFGNYKPGATLSFGSIYGDTIAQANSYGTLSFQISNYNASTGAVGAVVGSATGALQTAWANIAYDEEHDLAAGLPGEVSGGGLLFNVAGTINGKNFGLSSGLDQKFAMVTPGYESGHYDHVITYLDTSSFSVAFGDTGIAIIDALKAWFMASNVNLLGKSYNVTADIHARYSEVPEPASMLLMSIGLAGAGLARRRRLSAN